MLTDALYSPKDIGEESQHAHGSSFHHSDLIIQLHCRAKVKMVLESTEMMHQILNKAVVPLEGRMKRMMEQTYVYQFRLMERIHEAHHQVLLVCCNFEQPIGLL